jgi:hypothetical protein
MSLLVRQREDTPGGESSAVECRVLILAPTGTYVDATAKFGLVEEVPTGERPEYLLDADHDVCIVQ